MPEVVPYHLKLSYSVVRSSNEPEYYSYDILYHEWDEKKRTELYESWYKPYQDRVIRLNCLCNPNKRIDMVLSQRNDKVFLKTKNEMKEFHLPGCNFEGQTKGIYHKNWIQEEDGSITVRFEDSYSLKGREAGVTNNRIVNPTRERHTYNQITFYAFFYRLLINAWNININALKKGTQKKYPSMKKVYSTISGLLARKMKFGGEYTVEDVLFNGHNLLGDAVNNLANKKKLKLMVLLELVSAEKNEETGKYIIRAKHLETSRTFTINCDNDMWESAKASIRNIEGLRLVGGWITKQPGETSEFSTVTLIPVSSCGVPIESVYERTFYDNCHEAERLITRPIDLSFYPSWKGMLPDGLFIDTEVSTIVEIFGMSENNEQYHERKRHKIRHFGTLRENPNKPFDLWFWNAYRGDEMPELPERSQ